MANMMRDLRYAVRMLAKSPGFTIVAVVTLALGIGANSAIFSVVDAVLLKQLPYDDPDRIVMLWERPPKFSHNTVSPANYLDWKKQSTLLTHVAARAYSNFTLTGTGEPEQVAGQRVSANYFELLGVRAGLGRTFQSEAENDKQSVVLTRRFWQTHFAADPNILGRTILLSSQPYAVIGVLAPNSGIDRAGTQIFLPLFFREGLAPRGAHFLNVFGRLKPGVTLAQVQAEMDVIAAGIAERWPETNKGWGASIDPFRDRVISPELRKRVMILMGAVGLVLLVACTNVANLTLARVLNREREVAIRTALGATRWQIARQFLAESVLVSLAGAGLGFLAGTWMLDVFTVLMPRLTLPAEAEAVADYRTLVFALGLGGLSGVIFGIAPAWQGSKRGLTEALKDGAGAGGSGGRRLVSSALIVAEVALALTLLIGSGLLIRNLFQLQRSDVGFDAANVLTLHVGLPSSRYPEDAKAAVFFEEMLRRTKALPGVEQTALVTDLPVTGWTFGVFFGIEGQPVSRSERPGAHVQIISPDYFRVLKIPMKKGRAFGQQDQAGAPRVVIINETLAQRHFPNENPLGKFLLDDSNPPQRSEIVGVAGNVRVYGLGDQVPADNPEIYVSHAQTPFRGSYLTLRTSGEPRHTADAVRREIRALDAQLPITGLRTMEEAVGATLADERFNSALLGLFAATAGTLAAIGIFGVVAYAVARSRREVGIRMALGAPSGHVLKVMMLRGMRPALLGVVIGLGASLALTRVLAGLVSGVSLTDPATFAIAPLVLAAIALLACYVPGRRALRVDPMVALRQE